MIRIGIVGCGRILAAHLRGYRLLRAAGIDDFQVTALAARRAEDAQSFLRRGAGPPQRAAVSQLPGDPLAVCDEYLSDFQPDVPVTCHTDYARLVADPEVDAVHDCTTHALHHLVGSLALRADKHLLTQKPLAVTVRAARQMCALAEERGRVFGVFENFRFTPATRWLRWALDPRRLGPLQLALFGYVGLWWAPDRIVAGTPWRHRRDQGGGISLDLGVHFFDQLRHVAGEIESVEAQCSVIEPHRYTHDATGSVLAEIECDADDTCLAQFTLASGAQGVLVASWAGQGGASLFGSGSVFHARGGRIEDGDVRLASGEARGLQAWFQDQADPAEQAALFPRGLCDSFALAQADWLEAIRRQRPPETDGRQGLRDLAAAMAILESAQAGRRIMVDDVLAGRVEAFQEPLNALYDID